MPASSQSKRFPTGEATCAGAVRCARPRLSSGSGRAGRTWVAVVSTALAPTPGSRWRQARTFRARTTAGRAAHCAGVSTGAWETGFPIPDAACPAGAAIAATATATTSDLNLKSFLPMTHLPFLRLVTSERPEPVTQRSRRAPVRAGPARLRRSCAGDGRPPAEPRSRRARRTAIRPL